MDKAAAIVEMYDAGDSVPDICYKLDVPRATVYYHLKKFANTGSTERTPGSGKKRTKRTGRKIRVVAAKIRKDPFISIRQVAREADVSERTARRIVKLDLQMKSRARMKKQLVNISSKEKRLERCRILLNILKDGKPTIFFSDEKVFDLDSVSNSRLNRYLSSQKSEEVPENIRFKFQTKHPQSVMCFGLVASDGKKMDPFFWPAGTKINADAYIEVLQNHVKPWIDANYGPDENWVFMQDGAPCHTARKTYKWMDTNNIKYWPKEYWPPNSPDLNPLDFIIWAYVARRSNKTSHPNLDSLRAAIMKAWASMSPDYIRKTCSRFRPRLESVVRNKGGHIKD
jgi:transposase